MSREYESRNVIREYEVANGSREMGRKTKEFGGVCNWDPKGSG